MNESFDPDRTGPHEPQRSEPQSDLAALDEQPTQIGRYRLERVLGKGGFGLVYLAHDDQLQRLVAIKVPHRSLVSRPEDAEAYLTEARIVAKLDHPHIAAVFDVGSTEAHPFFSVSKFIEGSTLEQKIKDNRPSFGEAAELVATVAEALHYAHGKGVVHRDVKPGNILLDIKGRPHVADFGLALKEENVGRGPRFAGTPAYMSPEQARGEGHRVDGRSDIFSLGVVFYELLVGRRPFRGDTREKLLEQITSVQARPPRQWNDTIPKELERICLKALSNRASERYTTAKDFADDLRHFLSHAPGTAKLSTGIRDVGDAAAASTPVPSPVTPQPSARIVPKGLRSFDANDADFFLELLPGPRDREGLPESIRFWKSRIETKDPNSTFSVGLIYGPSGSGKSSLVKAGLLPNLTGDVSVVFVEATADETETRLLKGLRRANPDLPTDLGLIETAIALRRGSNISGGKKLLIVLDQFEQWLHAKGGEENTELVQTLRQCDGGRMQCLVMVRDDFWLAVSRFMSNLEVDLLQGQNMALVDLFAPRHAKKVLAAFGMAFGALAEKGDPLSKEQEAFLDQAVMGLSQDGKIISVRLALFADMVKGKPWTPATLKEVGGTEGVGVTFLEETFTASTAPPQYRLHQKSAQAVLKALLPDTGTDIKGNMRSHQELLAASGYAAQSKSFDALLRILDSELRLITPTDPEGDNSQIASSTNVVVGQKYYQLTHDYLVPSLRDWLTRKQKETRRGRAELLLADRASVWNSRSENRQLPSLRQWLSIRWLTAKKHWTPPQRMMMAKAGQYHAVRGLMAAVVLVMLGGGGYVGLGTLKANALRDRLLDANTNEVPTIVQDMGIYRRWINPLLHEAYGKAAAEKDTRKQLHASLALLPVDVSQADYLYDRLLEAAPHEVPVIRDALAPHKDELLEKLWAVVEKPEKGRESQRLRAASALAKYEPETEKWTTASGPVVDQLASENPVFLGLWLEGFRPIKEKLRASLTHIYKDTSRRESERTLATNILADYAAEEPQVLADLLMDADEKQFAVIYPKFRDRGEHGLPVVLSEIDKKLPPDMPSSDDRREKLAKRQANAAVALLRLKQPAKVWPLLRHSPDPRVRSYLIHRLSPLGADVQAVIHQLDQESDVTIRRALVLSLGTFREQVLPAAERSVLLPKLQDIYRAAADPGLHAATEWLLRTWKQEAWLKQVNDEWAKDREQQAKRLEGIRKQLASRVGSAPAVPPQWYVNGQGQTMVVIPGPVEFVMGSPTTEVGRQLLAPQHKKRIVRTFALAAKSVTLEHYRLFDQGHVLPSAYARMPDLPVPGTDWHMAAAYCNWLSKEEKILEDQWCYETEAEGQVTKLKANYLSLSGYRLPTEAEMEYATRAGATTSRYFGETEELLPEYAWYRKNSKEFMWPVGSLKPNDLGLFDVQGNVFTWCQERARPMFKGKDDEASEDKEDPVTIVSTEGRGLRGGSFLDEASNVRSAARNLNAPANRILNVGFRPARTLIP